MLDFLNSDTLKIMEKSLDALWQRQKVIADNIANIDTPDYKAKTLVFEEVLRDRLMSANLPSYGPNKNGYTRFGGSAGGIDSVQPYVVTDTKTEARIDGNNVDIDVEDINLLRTQYQYFYITRQISSELNLLKLAITEGKG